MQRNVDSSVVLCIVALGLGGCGAGAASAGGGCASPLPGMLLVDGTLYDRPCDVVVNAAGHLVVGGRDLTDVLEGQRVDANEAALRGWEDARAPQRDGGGRYARLNAFEDHTVLEFAWNLQATHASDAEAALLDHLRAVPGVLSAELANPTEHGVFSHRHLILAVDPVVLFGPDGGGQRDLLYDLPGPVEPGQTFAGAYLDAPPPEPLDVVPSGDQALRLLAGGRLVACSWSGAFWPLGVDAEVVREGRQRVRAGVDVDVEVARIARVVLGRASGPAAPSRWADVVAEAMTAEEGVN